MITPLLDFISAECFFRIHFHIYCPGCGGSRAVLALLRGNLIQSLKYNPIPFLFLVYLFITTTLTSVKLFSKGMYSFPRVHLGCSIGVLAFIIMYSILRNYLWLIYGIDLLGDFS